MNVCEIGEVHCVTCGDEALVARALRVDIRRDIAVVEIDGQTTEVDISLLDGVAAGDSLLIHGGVALSSE